MVVSENDNPAEIAEIVGRMMHAQYMHLYHAPNLIISVTGGARSFSLPLGLLAKVKNGLIRAAQTKHAWIITGGTNAFVTLLSTWRIQ